MYVNPPLMAMMMLAMMTLPILLVKSPLVVEWTIVDIFYSNINLPLMINSQSAIFSLVVLLISFSVMLFTVSYMNTEKHLNYFTTMVLLFVMSMNMLIYSPNLITLLMGWDGLGLTSYLLVIYYNNSKSLSAGMLTAMTNRLGDALLILAAGASLIASNWSLSSLHASFLVSLLIVTAAMTKSAQVPFSAWLPAAMAAPTPVSALVHSSTLVTAGIFLLIRFYPSLSLFSLTPHLCFYLGAVTCLLASSSALSENDLKKVVALSTLSQLGIMLMALGLNNPSLAFFHLLTHALFKALLFITAGSMIHINLNNQDIRLMGNMSSTSPINTMFFNAANLSLCGTPFMAGFYSKDSILETFFISSAPASTAFLLLLSVCMTSAYSLRLSVATLWASPKSLSTQYCSKFTDLSYLFLYLGAITAGSIFTWNSNFSPPTLPFLMKMFGLTFILTYSLLGVANFYSFFTSNMWFLTLISSNPLNVETSKLAGMVVYNEKTYMEVISGKGLSYIKNLNFINLYSSMGTSEVLSLMGLVMAFLLLSNSFCGWCRHSMTNTLIFQVNNATADDARAQGL